MRKTIVILLSLAIRLSVAQGVAKHVVTTTGSFHTNSECNLSWIIHSQETFVKRSDNVVYVQGFFHGINTLRSRKIGLDTKVKKLTIFPNPVVDVFTADISMYPDDQYNLEVIGVQGRIYRTEVVEPDLVEMDIYDINEDILVVRLVNKNDVTIASAKVNKKNN